MRSRSLLLVLFLCATSSLSFGWGCSGHQIVALIAEKQLTAHARQAVLDLLGGMPIGSSLKRFCTKTTLGPMADFSTWADDYREKEISTGPWHFWDIPLNTKEEPGGAEFCGKFCVNRAIERQLKVLRSPGAKREDRIMALMFVIHFMGDMHQPLHTISNNDRGGNCIPVTFFELQAKLDDKGSGSPNLHSLWDTSILERTAPIRRESHDADVTRFAGELSRRYGAQIARWKTAPVDIEAWAWESHQLAVNVVYSKLPTAVTPEDRVVISECTDNDNVGKRMLALNEHVGQPYVTAAAPVIERQLARAGARLAGVLNRALDLTDSKESKGPKGSKGAKPGATSTNGLGDFPPAPGVPLALTATVQPGASITFTGSGVAFTGNFSPSLAALQALGVRDLFFAGSTGPTRAEYTSVTLAMAATLPGGASSATIPFSVFTILSSSPGSIGFTPEGTATVSAKVQLATGFGPFTTTGPPVSLGLPQLMPSCSYQGCGPEQACFENICDCQQDKKRRVFECCP